MQKISTIDEFMDAIMTLSDKQSDWIVKVFMDKIHSGILKSLKAGEPVQIKVYIAWHHMYSLLGVKASKERLRSTALGVKDWLRDTPVPIVHN